MQQKNRTMPLTIIITMPFLNAEKIVSILQTYTSTLQIIIMYLQNQNPFPNLFPEFMHPFHAKQIFIHQREKKRYQYKNKNI